MCDPWGDPKCKTKNIWVACDAGEFKCDAINAPGILTYIYLRFNWHHITLVVVLFCFVSFVCLFVFVCFFVFVCLFFNKTKIQQICYKILIIMIL